MLWRCRTGFTLLPWANQADQSLVAWVSNGLSVDAASLRAFETDGKHYLYSTLRPVAPPKGSLRVVALKDVYLSILVLVVVIGGGLALLRSRLVAKCLALGQFVIALVLLAVFFPSFARRIVDGTLIGSVFIVVVVWILWWLVARYSARRLLAVGGPVVPGASQAPPPSGSDKPQAGSTEGGSANA